MRPCAVNGRKSMKKKAPKVAPVSQDQAEDAVRVLLRWAGDDPTREGLIDTPKRVVNAWKEWCSGYADDPADELRRTFEEVAGYDEMVVLRDIEFASHCEHHMAPIIGRAHVGYLPTNRVVGISKLAKVVEIFAKRLQTQETMTQQIADAITDSLRPAGVAVLIDANHQCMSTRGVHHRHVSTPEDPASAKMGESIYRFVLREMPGAFVRAWRLEADRLQRLGLPVWHADNEILQAAAVTLLLHGTMSPAMRSAIIAAVNVIPASDTLSRARTAAYLVTTSSQYQVQR